MPIAIGIAMSSANTELNTVTMNRSRMPKRRLSASLVTNSVLVKKLAWLACSDGIARISRNSAISAMATTMVAPAARRWTGRCVSPRRPSPLFEARRLPVRFGRHLRSIPDLPWARGADEPTRSIWCQHASCC